MADYSNCAAVLASCKANANSDGCVDKICSDYSSSCSTYITDCIANRSGDGCITKAATCATAVDASCTTAGDGTCAWAGGSCAVAAAPAVTCADKTGTDLTYTICTTHLSTCSVNLAGTACIDREATCADYTD